MKKIKYSLLPMALIFGTFNYALSQSSNSAVSSPCQDTYGAYPTSFDGQKCWLLHALKHQIYVYGDKTQTNAINYNPFSVNPSELDTFFKYNNGENNYYLEPKYTAWGGNWYACRNGGITRRFHGAGDYPKSNKLDWSAIKKLNKDDIYRLSPAEKMDIYLNDSSFSITRFELNKRGPERIDTRDDGFCGFCNGARIAGVIMPEPKHSVTLYPAKGSNPLQITFSVGDIKALLSATYMHPAFTFSFGLPSEPRGDSNPNPGIVDVMLRLYLARYKVPFIIDDSYGPAIFNETVMGYDRATSPRNLSITEKKLYPNASKAIEVNLTLYLQDELSFNRSETETLSIMGNKDKAINEREPAAAHGTWVHKKSYSYTLFIDNSSKIIDGSWTSEPIDFMWAAHGDGNEDSHVAPNDTPGIPKSEKNTSLDWYKVKFLLTKSLEP